VTYLRTGLAKGWQALVRRNEPPGHAGGDGFALSRAHHLGPWRRNSKERQTSNTAEARAGVREALLIEHVLRTVLPETIGLAHGELVCSNGTMCGECDLVVYDRDVPSLYRAEDFTVLPIEAVLGVVCRHRSRPSRLASQEVLSVWSTPPLWAGSSSG
jgi:hypothetical protein